MDKGADGFDRMSRTGQKWRVKERTTVKRKRVGEEDRLASWNVLILYTPAPGMQAEASSGHALVCALATHHRKFRGLERGMHIVADSYTFSIARRLTCVVFREQCRHDEQGGMPSTRVNGRLSILPARRYVDRLAPLPGAFSQGLINDGMHS